MWPHPDEIVILDPHAEARTQMHRLAPRPSDLNGKVIGVLDNTKANADVLVERVYERLAERFKFAEVIRRRQLAERKVGEMTPVLTELAERCDIVVNGVGD